MGDKIAPGRNGKAEWERRLHLKGMEGQHYLLIVVCEIVMEQCDVWESQQEIQLVPAT